RRLGRGGWFVLEEVEAGAAEWPLAECIDQRLLVDKAAARGVDKDSALEHRKDAPAVEQVAGVRRERDVQRDHVARREQIVEFERARACELDRRLVHERVVHADLEPEGGGLARETGAEPAEADHAAPPAAEPAHPARDAPAVPRARPA